jgi:ABC-type sugar transport system ATPase subunit
LTLWNGLSIFALYRPQEYRYILETFMLSIREVSKSFGALRALKQVSFDIEKNRVHGIIGPNGSGKTTLFNCITGHLVPEGGTIHLESYALTGIKPHVIAGMGIRRTLQGGKLVSNLTVLENVVAGSYSFRSRDLFDIFLRLPFRHSAIEQEIEEAVRALVSEPHQQTRVSVPDSGRQEEAGQGDPRIARRMNAAKRRSITRGSSLSSCPSHLEVL